MLGSCLKITDKSLLILRETGYTGGGVKWHLTMLGDILDYHDWGLMKEKLRLKLNILQYRLRNPELHEGKKNEFPPLVGM